MSGAAARTGSYRGKQKEFGEVIRWKDIVKTYNINIT